MAHAHLVAAGKLADAPTAPVAQQQQEQDAEPEAPAGDESVDELFSRLKAL